MNTLLEGDKITLVKAATVTGTTTLTTTPIDMKGFGSVTFLTNLGTAASGNIFKVQGGAASNGSDAADYASSHLTPASAGAAAITIVQPPDRYVTLFLTRGTTTVLGEVYAIQSQPKAGPVDTSGLTAGALTLISPVAGTA